MEIGKFWSRKSQGLNTCWISLQYSIGKNRFTWPGTTSYSVHSDPLPPPYLSWSLWRWLRQRWGTEAATPPLPLPLLPPSFPAPFHPPNLHTAMMVCIREVRVTGRPVALPELTLPEHQSTRGGGGVGGGHTDWTSITTFPTTLTGAVKDKLYKRKPRLHPNSMWEGGGVWAVQ